MKKFAKIIFGLVLSAVCAFTMAACFDLEGGGTEGGGDGELTGTVYKYEGTYLVGSDIEAGEYLMVKSAYNGYYQVTTEKGASVLSDKFLYNGNFNRQYVKVNDGEYLNFTGARLYKLGDEPKLVKDSDNGYKAGQYKAGRDIEAGEYVIEDSSRNLFPIYVQLTAQPYAKVGSQQFLYNENFYNRHYVKVEDGQYLDFGAGKLYSLADAPAVKKEADNGLAAGQYKAGRDLPAGEYIIVDKAGGDEVFMEQTTEPLNKLTSANRLFVENFAYRHYVKLEEGQYVFFKGGKLYSLEEAPKVKTDNGKYYAGQYKVGKDLAAGSYTVEVPAGTSVYYVITTLPFGKIGTEYFIKNDYLTKNDTITLAEGQYISINAGRLSAAA